MASAYESIIIVADFLLLFLKFFFYILESVYRIFVPAEEKSVAGEIVLITGAGHGIGKQLALKYASLGATVVCWDFNKQTNEETVDEIKKLGGTSAYAYVCDVSKRDDVLKVAERVKQEVGHVSILVNNAGIMPCHSFCDYKPEEITRLFDVNILAHCWILQAFLPAMIERNHGHVVALSSMAGIIGIPNLAPYCATKFAVRGLMEALNEEIRNASKGKANIHFTTVYPYMVNTGLCKNPKIRFESLLEMVPPEVAVKEIVNAQRRKVRELSIPSFWLGVNNVLRCFPHQSARCVADFFDSGVEPDS